MELPNDQTFDFSPFGLVVLDLVVANFVHNECVTIGNVVTTSEFFAV